MTLKEAGNDLPQVFAKSEADKRSVLQFLAINGIKFKEFSVGQIEVPIGENGSSSTDADASMMKKVRVVSTIDYYLIR